MNRTCSDMKASVADYLLGVLDEERKQAVLDHIRDCPDCRAYMQALQEQELALVTLGEQIDAEMDERQERVVEAVGRVWRGRPALISLRHGRDGRATQGQDALATAKWAVAAMLVLSTGIAIGRLTGPRPVDVERLKAEIQQAILPEVDQRLNSALATAADQTTQDMRVMAAQLASGSKAMMDARLAELIQLIETARRTDRQRVADALVQIELSRLDDRNKIAASLRSLAAPAVELSPTSQKDATTTNN